MVTTTAKSYCTFTLDEHFFGVEVCRVQEVLMNHRVTPVPLASPIIRGLVNLRGQIVTAIDLRRRLGLPDRHEGEPMGVVVQSTDGGVSLLVDDIGDVVEAESDSFESPPETLRGVAKELIQGTVKLKDRLLLVLDVDRTAAIHSELES